MATSKILYMKDCGTSFHGKHLKTALEYITAAEKTQDKRLVAGVNCQPELAYEQMKETKRKFGKTDKRQAYHLIISFVENEVDADTAFSLAEKFVKAYLGNNYEEVYAVHDNTDHIHAHVVFNSVSFIDGKKYRYEKGDWEKSIQPLVNRLCEEYGLSSLEIGTDRTRKKENGGEWDEYRDGPFVWSDMIKRDIDICLAQATSYEEFLQVLSGKGYEIKFGKHTAIKPMGMKKYRRLRSVGEDYTEERLRERVLRENLLTYKTETLEEAERIVFSEIPRGKRTKLNGLQKKYYAKLYRLGLIKRRPYSQAWKYKEDIRRMETAIGFYKEGADFELIKMVVEQKLNAHGMKELYKKIREKTEPTEPEKKAGDVSDKERDELYQKLSDRDAMISSQQDSINQVNSALLKLKKEKEQAEEEKRLLQESVDKLKKQLEEKETKVSEPEEKKEEVAPEEEKKTETLQQEPTAAPFPGAVKLTDGEGNAVYGIPIQYVITGNAATVPEQVDVERTPKKRSGLWELVAKLLFKKKSHQDIVRLVASGNLSTEQLAQIRIGMEKHLTESQLLSLINNDVPADRMKEIIEIAVLENGM